MAIHESSIDSCQIESVGNTCEEVSELLPSDQTTLTDFSLINFDHLGLNNMAERMSPDSSMDAARLAHVDRPVAASNMDFDENLMPTSTTTATMTSMEYDSDAFNSDDSCQSVPDLTLHQLMADAIEQGEARTERASTGSTGSPRSANMAAPNKRRRKKKRKAHSELFACSECEYTTRFKEHFASHLVKHSSDRNHMCSECGRTFKLKQALQRHMLIHRPSSRYACGVCGKRFSRKDHLNTHLAMHESNSETKRKECVCHECGAVFKNKKTLAGHMKTHEAQKRLFACDLCNAQYTRAASLRRHVRFKHGSERNGISCDLCHQIFSYPSTLEDHKRVAHNQGRRDFVCQHCGTAFAVKAYLAKHKISCENRLSGRRLQCHLCPKSFLTQRHLSDHQRRKHSDTVVMENHLNSICVDALHSSSLSMPSSSPLSSTSSTPLTTLPPYTAVSEFVAHAAMEGHESQTSVHEHQQQLHLVDPMATPSPMSSVSSATSPPSFYCENMALSESDNMGSLIRLVYGADENMAVKHNDDANLNMDNNVYMMYSMDNVPNGNHTDLLPSIFDVATC